MQPRRFFCFMPLIAVMLTAGFILILAGCSSSIMSIEDVGPYLAAHSGGATALKPINLTLQADLGTMTEAESGWYNLLEIIENEGKFVTLDLSACTMNDTEFNPDYSIETGKDFIVSITLPDMAASIADGTLNNTDGAARLTATFAHFENLKSFSGIELTSIGNWAFIVNLNLAPTELPEGLVYIGSHTFDSCINLAITRLPAGLTSIGSHAFWRCTKLALTELPEGLVSIGDQAFAHCAGIKSLAIPASVKEVGSRVFENWNSTQTIIIKGSTSGWDSNWQQNCYARIIYLERDTEGESEEEESEQDQSE